MIKLMKAMTNDAEKKNDDDNDAGEENDEDNTNDDNDLDGKEMHQVAAIAVSASICKSHCTQL